MYLIYCKFYFCTCILNKNNIMFLMHILHNMKYSHSKGTEGKGGVNVSVTVVVLIDKSMRI